MKKVFIVALLVFLSGCIKSVKTIDYKESLRPIANAAYVEGKETRGLSSAFKLLFFFQVTKEPDIKKAELDALQKEGGDNLIEVVYQKETIYILIGKIESYEVRGKSVKYR